MRRISSKIDFTTTTLPEGSKVTVGDGTVNYCPSKEVITKTETFKQIPTFEIKQRLSREMIKVGILR